MKRKRKIPIWGKVLIGVLVAALGVAVGIGLYANYLYGRMNVEKKEEVVQKEEVFEEDDEEETKELEETDPETVTWEETDTVRKEDQVVNILIAGEEGIYDDRGRTDAILVGTLNQESNSLKLTSFMRDLYVQIPGYSDNKLNAAYHNGGMPLLEETIEKNFDVELDGYVLVNFDDFEAIIDKIGGVEVTLSQTEASYLNRTNYITNVWNRCVYAGTNTLNGDQALGYARVRYVPNGDQSGDFGRTQRHRILLTSIFEKMRQKSLTELLALLPDMLSMVTTNLTREQCVEYVTKVAGMTDVELDTLRLPVEGAYKITKIRSMSVVLPQNLKKNVTALHDFIFEEDTLGEANQWKMEKIREKRNWSDSPVSTAS